MLENVMRSSLVSLLSDRICIEMCSLTIDDVDTGRLNDRYRATCGKNTSSQIGNMSANRYATQKEIRAKLA